MLDSAEESQNAHPSQIRPHRLAAEHTCYGKQSVGPSQSRWRRQVRGACNALRHRGNEGAAWLNNGGVARFRSVVHSGEKAGLSRVLK
jgi:hypothetical protein